MPLVRWCCDDNVVQYTNLSSDYLPALESLQEDKDLLSTYQGHGKRLSLDCDGNPLTGNEAIDIG